MARKNVEAGESFGRRLARLRKAAGFTQEELAAEIGTSRRVIAYYEAESQYPPADLLTDLARALGISTDVLLGVETAPKRPRAADSRIERRLRDIEALDPRAKRQIVQIIDTFITANRIKQKAHA